MQNSSPPARDKPCLALVQRGHDRQQNPKLWLVEFEWRAGAWRKTETPEEHCRSIYQAFKRADCIGLPPGTGRKRGVLNMANYERIAPLLAQGMSLRKIALATGISYGSVRRMVALIQQPSV